VNCKKCGHTNGRKWSHESGGAGSSHA
jgi:hypothetical protein